jgi:formiminotetrahydrofolate cyclodeaminase
MDQIDTLSGDNSLQEWLEAIGAPNATPAGGSAAALAAALAASLVTMVAGLTTRREKYAAVHDHARAALELAEKLRIELLDLAMEDAITVAEYLDALTLPQGTEFERTAREAAKRVTLHEAARVQVELLHRAAEVVDLAESMVGSGVATAIGDAATASFLAGATSRSAWWSVRSNLKATGQPEEGRFLMETADATLRRVVSAEQRVGELLRERLG